LEREETEEEEDEYGFYPRYYQKFTFFLLTINHPIYLSMVLWDAG